MSTKNSTPKVESVRSAARRLGISEDTLQRYIRQGRLPAFRLVGRLVRVRVEDVDALLRPIKDAPRS